MSTPANISVTVDPLKVEVARSTIIKAVEATESTYGRWTKAAEAIKAAWPTESVADKAALGDWIISGLSRAEREILALEADKVTDKAARKAAQDKVSQYKKRALAAAYPVPVAVPVEQPLTPAQADVKVAAEASKVAQLAWVQSANEAGQAKAEASVKAAEAKLAESKAKAIEAAAKLDATKAAEAAAAKVAAEAAKVAAEQTKAKAAEAEAASKVKAETAKTAQAEANAKVASIQLANKIQSTIDDAQALLLKAGSLEGAAGIVDFMTAMRNAVAAFKAANVKV
jgi:hypothetical protein